MRRLILSLAVLAFSVQAADIQARLETKTARKPALPFVLRDAAGKSVSLASFKGKTLLLDLWATKCGGCIKEIPTFIDMHHAYARQGLAVVGISMDIMYEELKGPAEAWSLVRPFVQSHKVDYPILMGDDDFTKRSAIEALPVTYLIDKQGRVAAQYMGVVDRTNLEANIKLLLSER